MNQTGGCVGAPMVAALADYLTSKGLDPGLVVGSVPTGDATVSVDRWQAMLRNTSEVLGDDGFALDLACYIGPRQLGLVAYVAAACGTVAEALQRCTRYGALVAENNPTRVSMHGNELELSWPVVNGPSGRHWDELGTALIMAMLRSVAGPDCRAARVHYQHAPPPDAQRYARYFGCEVRYGQPMPLLALPLALLQSPLPSADPALFALLEAQAAERLQRLRPVSSELQRYRTQLLQLLSQQKKRLADLAAVNRISPRGLQRRLNASGTTFQALLDDTRRDLASEYLSDYRLELHEVGGLLGYADQSSFTRAFQQWTGEAPGQWRRRRRRGFVDA